MKKKGFTIIELVLVIVVMGIASAGLAAALYQSVVNTHKPEIISTATGLAVKEAERIMTLSFANVADQNGGSRGSPLAYTGSLSYYGWEVRIDPYGANPISDYKQVEVRVYNSVIGYISIIFLRTNYAA